jgi:hypothetical protein
VDGVLLCLGAGLQELFLRDVQLSHQLPQHVVYYLLEFLLQAKLGIASTVINAVDPSLAKHISFAYTKLPPASRTL